MLFPLLFMHCTMQYVPFFHCKHSLFVTTLFLLISFFQNLSALFCKTQPLALLIPYFTFSLKIFQPHVTFVFVIYSQLWSYGFYLCVETHILVRNPTLQRKTWNELTGCWLWENKQAHAGLKASELVLNSALTFDGDLRDRYQN